MKKSQMYALQNKLTLLPLNALKGTELKYH